MAIYMKVDKIDGESIKKGHDKWTELHSLAFTAHKGGGGQSGSQKVAGVTLFEDIAITKNTDSTTPKILRAMCEATAFAKVEIAVTASVGKGEVEILKYTLEHVVFSTLHVDCGGEGRASESMSLNYNKIKIECWPVNDKNEVGGVIDFTWDINKAETA